MSRLSPVLAENPAEAQCQHLKSDRRSDGAQLVLCRSKDKFLSGEYYHCSGDTQLTNSMDGLRHHTEFNA